LCRVGGGSGGSFIGGKNDPAKPSRFGVERCGDWNGGGVVLMGVVVLFGAGGGRALFPIAPNIQTLTPDKSVSPSLATLHVK